MPWHWASQEKVAELNYGHKPSSEPCLKTHLVAQRGNEDSLTGRDLLCLE